MNFALKMIDFAINMIDFALKMMDFVDSLCTQREHNPAVPPAVYTAMHGVRFYSKHDDFILKMMILC